MSPENRFSFENKDAHNGFKLSNNTKLGCVEMGLDDIVEGAIGVFIVIILVVVLAPAMLEIAGGGWGIFGAILLVFFGIMVVIAFVVNLFK